MSINSVTPQEIANHHQAVGEKRVSLVSSHGAARKANDDRKCDLEIKALESLDVDSAAYYADLMTEVEHEANTRSTT